jgi:hypothetical protein
MTNRPLCPSRRRLVGRISAARTALTVLWFGRNCFGQNQKNVGYRQIYSSAMIGRTRLQPVAAKQSVLKLRFNIKRLSMQLSRRIGPDIRNSGRRKFGRICQRFWIRSPRRLWRMQSDNLSRSRQAPSGIGISPVRMKEHDVQVFFRHLPVVDRRLLRRRRPRPRHAGRAEGLFPRCSAPLSCGDRSGRPRRSGLPSAKSPQDQPSLRPGAEKPRAIEPRSRPIIAVTGLLSA